MIHKVFHAKVQLIWPPPLPPFVLPFERDKICEWSLRKKFGKKEPQMQFLYITLEDHRRIYYKDPYKTLWKKSSMNAKKNFGRNFWKNLMRKFWLLWKNFRKKTRRSFENVPRFYLNTSNEWILGKSFMEFVGG